MKTRHIAVAGRALLVILVPALLAGCEIPAKQKTQSGYRGTGMANIQNPRLVAAKQAANVPPPSSPISPVAGPPAALVYKNVQVLGGVGTAHFAQLMVAITSWVSPVEGCNYCHNPADLASDEKYTKVVSRRMLQMTQQINSQWQNHVVKTGVTCYTCHRGQPVPSDLWFNSVNTTRSPFTGNDAGQNRAAQAVNFTSLPYDPMTTYLQGDASLVVGSNTALPTGNRASIKQTEFTYALMTNISQSLGVNCTFCHNSRAFRDWTQSLPQRTTAWHAIRMAREINNQYLVPLQTILPASRLGPSGDAPKVGCVTCHKGVNKPLYGAQMLVDYPSLAAPVPNPVPAAPPAPVEGVPATEPAPAGEAAPATEAAAAPANPVT